MEMWAEEWCMNDIRAVHRWMMMMMMMIVRSVAPFEESVSE